MPLKKETREKIKEMKERYPSAESCILPSLHLVQRENGYLTDQQIEEVSLELDLPPEYVFSSATFYTMFNLKPVGKYHLQVCKNISCSLLGASSILDYLTGKLGISVGETTPDGNFTLSAVECLGACGGAPVMMVNDKYHENLTEKKLCDILNECK